MSVSAAEPTRAAGRLPLLIAMLACLASVASAEVRRLEVVGAIALDSETRHSEVPREKAIGEALWEGVYRVAAGLLVDSLLPDPNPVRSALGSDVTPYTRSFRILEDQGERPALFSDDPDAYTEYVVVVEVQVDVDRVKERLLAAGLLEPSGHSVELSRIRLEVRGLTQYRGYEELLALLLGEGVGARSVTPLEFRRGYTLLQVEAEYRASELLERLLASASAQLRITPLTLDDAAAGDAGEGAHRRHQSLTLEVSWSPPPSPEPDGGEEDDQLAPWGPTGARAVRPHRRPRTATPAAPVPSGQARQ